MKTRKLMAIILTIALALSLSVNSASNSTNRIRRGDVTGDGTIGIGDALEILKHLAGLPGAIRDNPYIDLPVVTQIVTQIVTAQPIIQTVIVTEIVTIYVTEPPTSATTTLQTIPTTTTLQTIPTTTTLQTIPTTTLQTIPTTTEPPVTTTEPPVTTTEPPVTTTEPPVTTTLSEGFQIFRLSSGQELIVPATPWTQDGVTVTGYRETTSGGFALTIKNDSGLQARYIYVYYRLLDKDDIILDTGSQSVSDLNLSESAISGGIPRTRLNETVKVEFTRTSITLLNPVPDIPPPTETQIFRLSSGQELIVPATPWTFNGVTVTGYTETTTGGFALTIKNDSNLRVSSLSVYYRLIGEDDVIVNSSSESVNNLGIGDSAISGGIPVARIRNTVRVEFTHTRVSLP